ncbi:hypothetical protein GCM10022251_70060 [Phytohabitans flavus]|uniref:Pyrrolo-quinoline quinone repeat domain-containing protein n=1 Tax=Phytohabitans flavus TaxID=1076124 RepID=A0A6F8Y8M6_9ACTN|nr:PQQ-binding-like beta-propeller repeat protein [Phytohabitans flavus]BCB82474.1 hypothetical protein Pflav_088840 [Phytohabitans flavus]
MVIDLGVPQDQDEVEVAPRRWSARQRRAVGAVLGIAALLGTVGAAAPVRSPLVSVTIQATAADDVLVANDALYLMRPSRGVIRAGLRTITRYRLADATTPEWEAAIYTAGPVRAASLVDGVLMAMAMAEGPGIETIAIRPDTGREVWRRSGWYHSTGLGHGLLQDQSPGRWQRVFGVDLATGDVRWSLEYPVDDTVLVDRGRFVHWDRSGMAELHDADTGSLLATAHLPFDAQSSAQIVGDLLLIPAADGRRAVVAYGMDRLDRRWQADIDMRSEYVSGECGDALCVGAVDGGGIRLVDAATGRTRWSAPGWGYAFRVGPRLLAYGPGQTTNPNAALLDPADGRVVGDLGEWNASVPADDGRMLGIRESSTRALVARLDPVAADAEVLGLLADVFQCQPGPVAVVCRRAGGSIGVWYPRRRL